MNRYVIYFLICWELSYVLAILMAFFLALFIDYLAKIGVFLQLLTAFVAALFILLGGIGAKMAHSVKNLPATDLPFYLIHAGNFGKGASQ